ncbi:MAG: right-handed parallel beta-helix repeat-containing protein [Verrucomicrobiae bacterium]|nr:right-handed parallel beta-helix repeat-containing protein [Verrucomicrobiae bacterium]
MTGRIDGKVETGVFWGVLFGKQKCLACFGIVSLVMPLWAAEFRVEESSEVALKNAIEESRQSPGTDRILLPAGTIRLTETLVLTRADDGLTIAAADPTQPCWVSGSTLLGADAWMRVAGDDRPLWRASIPGDWPDTRSLFFEGKSLPRARSRGYVQLAEPPESMPYRVRRAIDQQHLYLPREALDAIPDFAGAEMRLVPKYPWVTQLLPMTKIDREHGLVWSEVPGTYPMTPPAFGQFPEGSLWIENMLPVLDEPGEWVFDPATRTVTLWPPDGKAPGDRVAVPRLTELLRIEGEADESNLEDHPAKGIAIRGITFAHANAYAWEKDKTGWGLQHDWEMYDRPTAMVRLRYAENCHLERCRFVNAGSAGLRLDLHCRGNHVRRCEFTHLGGVGILLAGYGMGFKDVNRDNIIADNHISHVGEVWWHSPGIFVWQSGHNRIVHNRLHDLPYTAIVVSTRSQLDVSGVKESSKTVRWDETTFHLESRGRTWEDREPLLHGRENEVGWNDISRVMEVMGDGNGIYISGTGAGNRVHHNFIHDVIAPNMNAAIRCDDDQNEVTLDHNVIARVCGEGFIWKGRCDILNNLIYALRSRTPDGGRTEHARGFLVLSGAPVEGSVVKHNIFVGTEPRYQILYEHDEPWMKGGRKQPAVRLASCEADENLYWNPANPGWAKTFFEEQRARGVERNSVFADPHLESPKTNDFSFPGDSPAAKLGIESIDVSAVGPRPDSKE